VIIHRKITTPDFKITLKRLYPDNKASDVKDSMNMSLSFPVTRIHNIDDIRYLKNDRYGLLKLGNYPLVDAVIQPNILIQIATSPKKHSGATKNLQYIRSLLRESDESKHMMIFIVPIENCDSFEYQNLEEVKGREIQQYLGTDEDIASIQSLLNPYEQQKYKKQKK
jgi:hypothetical protein